MSVSFQIAMLIVLFFVLSGITFAWFKIFKEQTTSTLREFSFLFRWFLIGKYHCNATQKQKMFLNLFHKILWGGVIVGWGLFIADLIEQFIKG